MKTTIKFDLDDPDDIQAHLRCVKSLDMACVLSEFSANSRKRIEAKFDENGAKNYPVILDVVFEEFNDLMSEHNINIDELIS